MPVDFDLGIKKLEVAYFSLQTKFHPDRFSQKSATEKMFSMQHSVIINEAYEILKNPLSRSEYMLKLAGIIVNSDNSTVKASQTVLMESMATREKLAEISSAEEMRQLIIDTMESKLCTIDTLKQNFIDGKLEEAAQNTIKLRYLEKLTEEIKVRDKGIKG